MRHWTALLFALVLLTAGVPASAKLRDSAPKSLVSLTEEALREQRDAAEARVAGWREEIERRDRLAARLEEIAQLAIQAGPEQPDSETPPPGYGGGPLAGALSFVAVLVALCVVTRKEDAPWPRGLLTVAWVLIILCLALLPFRASGAEGDRPMIDDAFRSEVEDASRLVQLSLQRRAVLALEALESGGLQLPLLEVSSPYLKPLASVSAKTPGHYFSLAALYLELGEEARAEDNLARLLGEGTRYRPSEQNDVIIAGVARHLLATDRRREAGAFLASRGGSIRDRFVKLELATQLDEAGVGEGIEALGLSSVRSGVPLASLERWGGLAARIGSADLMKAAWRAAAPELGKKGWRSIVPWLRRMEEGAVRGLRPEVLRFGFDLAGAKGERAEFARSMLVDPSIGPSAEDFLREGARQQSTATLVDLIVGAVQAEKPDLTTEFGLALREKRRAALSQTVKVASPVHEFAELVGQSEVELSIGVLLGACYEKLGQDWDAGRHYINTVRHAVEQVVESHGLVTPLNLYDLFHLVSFLEGRADASLRSDLEVLLRTAASTTVFGAEADELQARLATHHPEAAAWSKARSAVVARAARLRPEELWGIQEAIPENLQEGALEAIEAVASDLGVFSGGGPSLIERFAWASGVARLVWTWVFAFLLPLALLLVAVWLRWWRQEGAGSWPGALDQVGIDVARTVILLPLAAVFYGAAWAARQFQVRRSEP